QPVPPPHAHCAHGPSPDLRVHGLARGDRTRTDLRVPAATRHLSGSTRPALSHHAHGNRAEGGRHAMSTPITVGRVAELVRSKNAGPFWQTLDIFFANDQDYRAVAENPSLNADAIARLYRVDAGNIHIYRIPDIRAVNI